MVHNTVQPQFNCLKQDGTKEHHGPQRPNWLSFSLVTEVVENCVPVLAVDDEIQRTVVWVPVRKPLPTFHLLHLSDLKCCLLRDEIFWVWHNISRSKPHSWTLAPTLQQTFTFSLVSPVVKFGPKNTRIPDQLLHSCTKHWRPHTLLCEGTQMLAVTALPPCSCSVVKPRSTSSSRVFALHSHVFCRMELLFAATKPIPLYGISFPN